jgi:hypothetical protein
MLFFYSNQIKALFHEYKIEFYLLCIYFIFVSIILACYPCPQINGDGGDYIYISANLQPGVRAIGYCYILKVLNHLFHSIYVIIGAQFLVYYFSIIFFLRTVSPLLNINGWKYYVLGTLLLIEPTTLYYCIFILSDVFFTAFTLLYLSTLFLYISKCKKMYFIIHLVLLLFCIEIRLAGLVYLVFSSLVFFIWLKDVRRSVVNVAILFFCWLCVYSFHLHWAKKVYGTAVYSSFSGWNSANDALYIQRHIKADTGSIRDPQTRQLYSYFSHYLDTCAIDPQPIGSDYLWVDKSPLNVLRRKWKDSLKIEDDAIWAALAPGFGKYGRYVQTHFPIAYIRWYMGPGLGSLITPHNEELQDYYVTPINDENLPKEYHIVAHCNYQLYKNYLNKFNIIYYQVRLALLVLCMLLFLVFYRRFDKKIKKYIFTILLFTSLYYLLILYSSWFVFRFLMPVFPLMDTVIFATLIYIIDFDRKKTGRINNI